MTEAWFDGATAGLVGGSIGTAIGVWGGAVGTLSSWLVPKCRGRRLLFGLLGFAVAAGLALLITGLVALVAGQPYHVRHPFDFAGVMLAGFGGYGWWLTRYRVAEERRMALGDFA